MQAPSQTAPIATRVASAVGVWQQRYRRFVLIAMLAALHVAAVRGSADESARALLLAHLGLVLLWQPFLRGEQRVGRVQVAFIALGAVVVMLWLDWWLLALWVVVLAGLVGGGVFLNRATWQRRANFVVLLYLLALLAVVILPEMAPGEAIAPEMLSAAEYGLPILIAALALMPAESESADAPQVIDFFYSVFLMLVLGVVILGSFTFMTLGRIPYLQALAYTALLIAGTILAVGLAWNPRTGHAGLHVFFSRYLFSIGLPMEKWLRFLAELSHVEPQPERFLAEGVAGLARLPWIAGAAWRAGGTNGETGARTEHTVEFENDELALTVYSLYATSPALHWHLRLLGQLLGEFYVAKLREQKLQQASYMQAVHETGARTAHDVKNLLQSLTALCSVLDRESGRESPQLQSLIRRQLPAISRRLGATLERLQNPDAEAAPQVAVCDWWEALKRQYQGQQVEFSAENANPAIRVPRALFDSVADNLLQNAIAKRADGSEVRIRATLRCRTGAELRICDSGRAIPSELAHGLLHGPVASASGLGIGLYQAARHAESLGYTLSLRSNREGEVCFALTAASPRQ